MVRMKPGGSSQQAPPERPKPITPHKALTHQTLQKRFLRLCIIGFADGDALAVFTDEFFLAEFAHFRQIHDIAVVTANEPGIQFFLEIFEFAVIGNLPILGIDMDLSLLAFKAEYRI